MSYTRGFHPRRNVRRLSRGHRPSDKARQLFREPATHRRDCSTRHWERSVDYSDPRLYDMSWKMGQWFTTELEHLMEMHAVRLAELGGVLPAGRSVTTQTAYLTLRSSCERSGIYSRLTPRTRR